MKNYELLDIIGEADEGYVQAADSDGTRPRTWFGWKTFAACAACAALIAAVYPVSQAFRTKNETGGTFGPEAAEEVIRSQEPALIQGPGLHSYTLVEEQLKIMTTESAKAVPPFIPYAFDAGIGAGAGQAEVESGAAAYSEHSDDTPVQEEADSQYSALLQWLFGAELVSPDERYPEWFGGVWIDNSVPEARLAVAIVEGFHTSGLEAQIRERCGGTGEILFPSVKYSRNELTELMDKIGQVFEKLDCQVFLSYGLDEIGNRIGLDFFEVPSDEVLAALDELDPDGDAIFIQVFIGSRIAFTDEAVKGSAPAGEGDFPEEAGGDTEPVTVLSAAPDSAPAQSDGQAEYDVLYGSER